MDRPSPSSRELTRDAPLVGPGATAGRRRLVSAIRSRAWAILDHALISGSTFFLLFALARALPPSPFGTFVLAYTVLVFTAGLQWALITQPHNVLGATRSGPGYASYTTTIAVANVAFSGLVAVATFVTAMVAALVEWMPGHLLLALAPALFAWQLQEFGRRALYTERRFLQAFVVDVVGYGGLTAVIAVLWWRDALTGPRALYVLASTSALATLVAARYLRRRFSTELAFSAVRENWRFGKWLGVAMVGSGFSLHLYMYLVAGILGAASAGVLRAAHLVLGPLNVLVLSLVTVLPIDFSRALGPGGVEALRSRTRLVAVATGPVVLAYCLATALAAEPILRTVFRDEYAAYASVLALVCVYYFVVYVAQVLFSVLSSLGLTKQIARANIYAAVATFGTGLPLILRAGINGAVVAMIIGVLVLASVYWHTYAGTASHVRSRVGSSETSAESSPDDRPRTGE